MRFLFIVYFLFSIYILKAQDSISYDLDSFIFIDNKIYNSIGQINFTNRDFKKLSASFDDPSRLLIHYPGFSGSNDQANPIIFRGMPSSLFSWQLNGIDIVNPNHLSNAGIGQDIGAFSSGGVNAFSGNTINKYQFKTSNFNSPSLGGLSNIEVDGIDQNYLQLSLLGLESGFNIKRNKTNIFANYRYSFTGILSDLGVKFGNEDIRFRDLVCGMNHKTNRSRFKIVFLSGKSSNIHTPPDDTIRASLKDNLNIGYNSNLRIINSNYEYSLNEKAIIELKAIYSDRKDNRTTKGDIFIQNPKTINDVYSNNESKTAFDILVKNENLGVGLKFIHNKTNLFYNINQVYEKSIEQNQNLIIPYFSFKFSISKYLSFNAQLNPFFVMKDKVYINGSTTLEFKRGMSKIYTHINKSSQALSYNINNSIAQSQGISFDLGHIYSNEKIKLSTTVFSHYYYDLIGKNYFINFDNFYIGNEKIDEYKTLVIRGGSLGFEYNFNRFWTNLNASIFDTDKKIETSYKYSANINLGKDIKVKNNKLSITASYHFRGPQPIFSINNDSYTPIKNFNEQPLLIFDSYSRMDMRINYYLKKSFWSLDIQNVTGKINYTHLTTEKGGQIVKSGGLGFIPVLTWKRYF